jgi:serine protease SohB
MEFLIELGLFSLKALIIVGSIVVVLITLAVIVAKNKFKEEIEVKNLNSKLKKISNQIRSVVFSKSQLKAEEKKQKQSEKSTDKQKEAKRVFVLSFDGDIKASQVGNLRTEISAVLQIARKGKDEVVIKLESPGGMVHGYGLAAAQLLRIKNAGISLTVCVDKVAASGGYMMACTANKIISAPFAILGSIGVMAQVPNVHRLLKKHDIDYEEITAGEYKRTISMLGEITEKGRTKFKEDMEDTHVLFKEFVNQNRPLLDIAKVATGEHWFGLRAQELNLSDEIMTSDDYLLSQLNTAQIYSIAIPPKKKFQEKLSEAMGKIVKEKFIEGLKEEQLNSRFQQM